MTYRIEADLTLTTSLNYSSSNSISVADVIKRDERSQSSSPNHLRLLSQAKDDNGNPEPLDNYRYEEEAGQNTYIYIIVCL